MVNNSLEYFALLSFQETQFPYLSSRGQFKSGILISSYNSSLVKKGMLFWTWAKKRVRNLEALGESNKTSSITDFVCG